MTSAFNDTGITLDRYDDQVMQMVAAAEELWGAGINTDEDQLLGHQIRQIAYLLGQLNEILLAIYNSKSVSAARGIRLDQLLELIGLYRQPAAYSRVLMTYTVNRATTVPAGHKTKTAVETVWATTAPLVFTEAGSATVWAQCTTEGPIAAEAGDIDTPQSAVYGLVSVTNATAAIPGRARETDAQLKRRHTLAVDTSGDYDLASIYEAVYQVSGVSAVYVTEDPITVSVEVSVIGGDDDEVAAAINTNLTAGVRTTGTTVVDCYSEVTRQVRQIRFIRAALVPVYLKYVITVNPNLYPEDGDDLIKAAVVAAFDPGIADTISYLERVGPVYTVPGVTVNAFYMGLSAPAAGLVDLPMTSAQKGSLSVANITIERA